MEKLSITITDEQAELIQTKVAAGEYASTSEFVRAAIRSLQRDDERHRDQIESIRARIQASIDDPRPAVEEDEMHEFITGLGKNARERGF